MQAIVLAATMEDVYTIIGIVQARFPDNDPAAAPFLATARTKRNSFVPAQTLPPELLTDIFRRALPEPIFEGFDEAISNPHLLKTLIDFSLVCQQWKAIIDDAASLWAFLSADSASPSTLEHAIEKSQSAPLVITTGKRQLDIGVFLNMVTPHIHRCRVLCCMPNRQWRENGEQQAIEQLLQQPAPILEELRVAGGACLVDSNGRYIRQPIQIWALENFAASLRVLRLVSVDWSWTPVLSNLQDLQLSLVAISITELIDCLATTTQLRSLHLSNLRDQVIAQQPAPSQSVTLPFLHQIYIEDVSTPFISLIISNLVPPSLKRLTLSTDSCNSPPPFTDITPYYHDLVRSIASTKTEPICIYIEEYRQWFAISDVDNDLEVVIRGAGLRTLQARTNFARWLAGIWNPLSSVATVALFLGSRASDSRDLSLDRELILPLMSISNVERLQIQENVEKVQLLYRRLSYPVLSEGGTKCWLFPKLTNLEIFGQAGMELELVRMVEGRYDALRTAAGGAAGNGPEPPAMLEQFKLCRGRNLYYSPTTVDRLRRIVGDGKFVEVHDLEAKR
ncbi:hypothetical protein FRC04_002097 [Tulasnella sp. 424]|nr:hypothetical protein FRC04_002097 [Tulasnella sp. 424]KAG8967989.1 hypothetical protein FRC05_001699 [Tulasnella sp. 425]